MAYQNYFNQSFLTDPDEMRRRNLSSGGAPIPVTSAMPPPAGVTAKQPSFEDEQQGPPPLPPTTQPLPTDDLSGSTWGPGASAEVSPGSDMSSRLYGDAEYGVEQQGPGAYYGTYGTDPVTRQPRDDTQDWLSAPGDGATGADVGSGDAGADGVGGSDTAGAGDVGDPGMDIYGEDGSLDWDKVAKLITERALGGYDKDAEVEAARAAHEGEMQAQRQNLAARAGRFGGGGYSAALQNSLTQQGALDLNRQLADIDRSGYETELRGSALTEQIRHAMQQEGADMASIEAMKAIFGGGGDGDVESDPSTEPGYDDPTKYEGDAYTSQGEQNTVTAGNSASDVDAAFGKNEYDVLQRDSDGNPTQISLGAPGTFGGLIYRYEDGQWVKDDIARFGYNSTGYGWGLGAARAAGSDIDWSAGGQRGEYVANDVELAARDTFGSTGYQMNGDFVTLDSGQTYKYNKQTGQFEPYQQRGYGNAY